MSFPYAMIGKMFKDALGVVKAFVKKPEDLAKVENAMREIENKVVLQYLDFEKALMTAQANVVRAEAQGHSWLQRNWRPVTMLTFLVMFVANQLGLLPVPLPPEAMSLLKIGLGGYVIGRSVEKSGATLYRAMREQPK